MGLDAIKIHKSVNRKVKEISMTKTNVVNVRVFLA